MANSAKPGKSGNALKTGNSYVTTTSTGNPLYSVGATGKDVDTVGNYLVNNGYLSSYSGKYDSNMQNALVQAKQDLLGPNSKNNGAYKGGTFGAATLNAIANANQNTGRGQNLIVPPASPTMQALSSNMWNYMQNQNALEDMTNQYVSTIQQGQDQANAALNAARQDDLSKIRALYDDSARNYYRLYKSQKNDLPEQLSSIGATGGASESAALRLMSAYSGNLANNENARNNQIYNANSAYNQQIAQNSQAYANQLAELYYNIGQQKLAADNEFRMQQQQIMAEAAAIKQEQEAAAAAAKKQAEIDAWNAKVDANIARRRSQGYDPQTWEDGGKHHYTIAGQTPKTNNGSTKGGSSGSKKKGSVTKPKSGGSGGSNDKPKGSTPKTVSPAAGTDYAVAFGDVTNYGSTGFGGALSFNPLARRAGAAAALSSYDKEKNKKK